MILEGNEWKRNFYSSWSFTKISHRVSSLYSKNAKLECSNIFNEILFFSSTAIKIVRRIKFLTAISDTKKCIIIIIFLHLCLLIYSLSVPLFILSKINHKNYSNVKIFFHLVRKISLINTFHFILLMPYFARCAHEMLIKIFMLYCFMQMLNKKKQH